MIGKLYIDGIDAYIRYGVVIVRGELAQLVQWPALKAIEINDWPEEDGIEPDLTTPVLDSRQFSIKFAAIGSAADVGGFIYLLSNLGSYHAMAITDLGKTYNLRLISNPDYSEYKSLSEFSLEFADDYPLEGYTYSAPSSNVQSSLYDLDDKNLSEYGIVILQGTFDELLNVPKVKTNLLINLPSKAGAIYDDHYVKFQEKDITLKCLLKPASISAFWQNYDALLFDLTKAGQRELYMDDLGEAFPCFYKSSSVNEFLIRGAVWCKFDITLTVITFTAGESEFILITEDGLIITTEDGLSAIDLKIS